MNRKTIIKICFAFFLVVFGLLVFFFVIRSDKNFTEFKEGKAEFHNFNYEIVDSLIRLESSNSLLNKLFVISDPRLETLKYNILDSATRSSRGFLAESDCPIFPAMFTNDSLLATPSFLLSLASSSGLKAFAGDSVYIPSLTQLNSIGNDEILSQYQSFQNSFLASLGFNGKILELFLPEGSEKKDFDRIANRLKSEISNLHENNQLSIINFRNKEISIDSIIALRQKNLIKDLIETGLCGIIFDNQINLELFDSLGFDGLYIFDSSKNEELTSKIIELTDVFILPSNETRNQIFSIIENKLRLNSRRYKAFKVLRAALWTNQKQVSAFTSDYSTELWFRSNISKSSIILLKNSENIIPISNINHRFLIVNTSGQNIFHFKDMFSKYAQNVSFIDYDVKKNLPIPIPAGIDHVIVILGKNIAQIHEKVVSSINEHMSTIYVHYGEEIEIPLNMVNVIMQIHDITDESLSYAAQLIFGGIPASGIVSTKINDSISFGYQLNTKSTRLEYTIPENAGLCSQKLMQIDSIVINAIVSRAFPGAQVLVAKQGKVVYNKSFGHHDYSRARQVKESDLYDIASISKIAATTLAAMKLHEQNKLNINYETGRYFKDTTIDYSNTPADTLVFIDTLNIARLSKSELAKLIQNKDTLRINDTILTAKETIISRVTPNLNIFKIPIRKLLVHQSGMSPSLPILPYIRYQQTFQEHKKNNQAPSAGNFDNQKGMDTNAKIGDTLKRIIASPLIITDKVTPRNYFFSTRRIKDTAEVMITEKMYLRNQFSDSIFHHVKKLRVHYNARLQYACMNMILVQMVIDSINNTNMDLFLKRNFYTSLGMVNTTFNPLDRIAKTRIIPTEDDRNWRKQQIHGTVHDPSAALLGGIAGNAGLFSTAEDLAILGQMWLNGGNYGGRQYLNPSTIKTFTGKQPENHRGLGFDKPSEKGIHAESVPKSAYGHLGFTGCAMWVDPENEIVFIFLSNRINPSVSNQRINTAKIRQRVHQAVYDSFLSKSN